MADNVIPLGRRPDPPRIRIQREKDQVGNVCYVVFGLGMLPGAALNGPGDLGFLGNGIQKTFSSYPQARFYAESEAARFGLTSYVIDDRAEHEK